MPRIAREKTERLKEIKKMVQNSYQWFEDNFKRYREFTKFVFETALSSADEATLTELGKPNLQFNILESFISRLRGEFAKQQPSLTVRASDGVPDVQLTEDFTVLIKLIESHLKSIFFDGSTDKVEYQIYSDLLAGGFSVVEVFTDYVNDLSFEQNINVERVFDPTLCGFDPMARDSHKGDGRYCFQLYPKTREEFEIEFGKKKAEEISYNRGVSGFGWSYRGVTSSQEDIAVVCDFYEKKIKREKIVKISDGRSMTKNDYDKLLEDFEADESFIEQPPIIVNERMTERTIICRYRLCESEILDYVETDFEDLPLVFIDGNSVYISNINNSTNKQMTRPYVYHAKDAQRFKNFAGQSYANEIENIIQHKFMVARQSIPEDKRYQEAYQNIQRADTVVYEPYDPKMPDKPLPPPQLVPRQPIPQEIPQAFKMADDLIQTILGSYDASQGVNRGDISGTAIALGAMQSNAAAMPYVVGYIRGLNRIAQIIVNLIPKYYKTPRSLPILDDTGRRSYIIVNREGGIKLDYEPNALQVKVDTGVNFGMQKEIALKTIVNLMQASPAFSEFINSKGLMMLLDNIEIRGIDEIKQKAIEYEKEKAESNNQQQQAQQQAQQQQAQMDQETIMATVQRANAETENINRNTQSPTRTEVEMAKLREQMEKDKIAAAQKQQELEIKFAEVISKINSNRVDNQVKEAELAAETSREMVESVSGILEAIPKPEIGETEVEINLL